MNDIGHMNIYMSKKDYAYLTKVKQKIAKDTGKKTWLDIILFLFEQYDKQESESQKDINIKK